MRHTTVGTYVLTPPPPCVGHGAATSYKTTDLVEYSLVYIGRYIGMYFITS